MNKILHNLLVVNLLVASITIHSQQDPQFTQYMFNTMIVNPAYVGSSGHGVINLLGRAQWIGVEGAPQTQTLSYDTPLGYSGIGLGINLMNDAIGPARETHIDANISYTVRTSKERNLSFGLKLGGRFFNIDWTKGEYRDKEDMQLSAPINSLLPSLGVGIYYHTENWYLGIAIPSLLRTNHYDDVTEGGSVTEERMHYFLIAGYVIDLNERIKFKPALLTKAVSGAPLSLDVSANFLFNEKFRAGLAWRLGDAISTLLGFQISKSLQLGYSYDLTTSNYSNYNSGAHEILFRYEMFKAQTGKSPRFF